MIAATYRIVWQVIVTHIARHSYEVCRGVAAVFVVERPPDIIVVCAGTALPRAGFSFQKFFCRFSEVAFAMVSHPCCCACHAPYLLFVCCMNRSVRVGSNQTKSQGTAWCWFFFV